MQLERIKSAPASSDLIEVLQEDGAVIVEGLLGRPALDQLNDELDPFLDEPERDPSQFVNLAVADFFGRRTRHVAGVAAKCPTFVREVLCHGTYLTVCDAVLRPNCARYQLNLAHVLDRRPGAEQQMLHRDEDLWINIPRPHAELQVSSVIALDDFSADNGATVIVPGSHRWDRDREPGPGEPVAAEMAAGSAVIYLGSTIHAGGPNVTRDRNRRGMHLSYVLGWLRTEENQFLAVPPGIARTMPACAQELLGYAVHDAIESAGGYLGAVELQDPIRLLRSGAL
jgi:ectoine hydroxylase-related dioxygenase (phytanoyl-CoA dioxygenase family)